MAFGRNVRTLVLATAAVAAIASMPSTTQATQLTINKVADADADTEGTVAPEGDAETTTTKETTTKETTSTTSSSSGKGWLNPVVVKGNKFFDSVTGLEFRIKGMAYYPRPNGGEMADVANYDWAADIHEDVWAPHLKVFQDLGVNTIRLYSVDPSVSHDKFMCACADAGIYVLVGMAAPCENCALLDLEPPKCYPDELFSRVQMVYNAFAVYDNTLGFSIANENNLLRKFVEGGSQTMPCAKALMRDARNYAATCAGFVREVPIGIDLADIPSREGWLSYMDCAADDNEFSRAEWVGFNPYVECDPKTHLEYADSTGLQSLMKDYEAVQYPRPLMFGEFGCNLGENTVDGYENQRTFLDAKWMNEESEMTEQIVGGNVFEFVTEIPNTEAKALTKVADEGRYGVGYFSPDECDHDKIPCEFVPYPEYEFLKKAYTSTKESTLTMDAYTISREKVLSCPANITSELQDMPTSIEPLSCSNLQPVCHGTKSNAFDKSSTVVVKLGAKRDPSNKDVVMPGDTSSQPDGSAAGRMVWAVSATALSVLAAVVLA